LLIFALQKIKKDKSSFSLVISVFFLGLLFSFFQLNGWQSLTQKGVYLTGAGSNVAGSFLYILTLSHLVHLLGGLIALLVTSINIKRGKYSSQSYLGVELTCIYWIIHTPL
jgi:cytochrome c oxidase subunit 3